MLRQGGPMQPDLLAWPQTPVDLPACASQVPEFEMSNTMPCSIMIALWATYIKLHKITLAIIKL